MGELEKVIKNITAERITVGIVLNHPEWLVELNGLVKTEHFYLKSHKTIFAIIGLLMKDGSKTIDTMSILSRAERISKATEVLEDSGGIEYLEEIKYLAEDYTLDDLKMYAKEVASCSFKREVYTDVDKFQKLLVEHPEWSMEEVEGTFQERHQGIVQKYSSGQAISTLGEVFDNEWQEMEDTRQSNGIVGLPTKFALANEYFTYMPSELVVIGARAKYGKSTFGINEVHNLAVLNNVPVAVLDTEMKTKTFMLRLVALDSGVTIKEIQTGRYLEDEEKVEAVEASKKRIKKAPIIHKYDFNWDRAKVATTAKLLKLRYGIALLIYDYIKVMEVTSSMKEHSELGNWTIFLKNLAGELDIPILTFGQLSPFERRLADSDKINRYASTIAYLLPKSPEEIKRDFGASEGGTDFLYVDYNRNGGNMQDDESKGVNFIYRRDTSTMVQAKYQILLEQY